MHPTEMLLPRRGLLLLVLLATAAGCTEAQLSGSPGDGTATGPYPGSYAVKVNPAVASLLIVFICGFFCLGLFSLYLRRCAAASHATSGNGGAGAGDDPAAGVRRSKGLDLAVLETFPTMAYAKAMQLRAGKEALECAVCLSEFSDEDVLRLLPGCCHVFHVHCIDAWLESHVTCPVCRSDLSDHSLVAGGEQPSTIEEGVELEGGDLEVGLTPPAVPVVRRWNSTGHEAYPARAEDRHTLRLPEDVRMEFVQAGRLRRAASLAVPAGAGASGNPDTAGRSGRWGFLLRTFSVRRWTEGPSASAATGSSRRVFPSVGAGDAGGKPESGMQHDDGDSSSSTAAYPTERI